SVATTDPRLGVLYTNPSISSCRMASRTSGRLAWVSSQISLSIKREPGSRRPDSIASRSMSATCVRLGVPLARAGSRSAEEVDIGQHSVARNANYTGSRAGQLASQNILFCQTKKDKLSCIDDKHCPEPTVTQ